MKFILLDGNSFCYRAFYAIRELRTSKGEPTNAVYGVITMLEKLLKELDPDGVAVAFDVKGPTFRHKRYEEYKIQRKPMPDELVSQMPLVKEVLAAMNVPIYEKQGYEADDVIATVAKKLKGAGHEVFIATGDKDMLQLVDKRTRVVNPQKENFVYDEAQVKKRFGVGPDRVVEVMALMGDASDNIPGVDGVGEVTAMKLIAEFGTLEGLYKHLDRVKSDRLRENLTASKDIAFLSRELATIDSEVPLEVRADDLVRREPDQERLVGLYRRFEFRTLLKHLPAAEEKNADDPELAYRLITDRDAFKELAGALAKKKEWAFDFETTDTNPLVARPVGISFAWKEKEAVYVAFGPEGLDAKKSLEELRHLFEDPKIRKIGQNLKYEALVLKSHGIGLEGIAFDTMVASYCLNPAKPNHNLDDIAMEHLGVRITPITDLIGTGKAQITMDRVPLDKVYRYGCQDSDVTVRLARILGAKLEEKGMKELFEEIEMPLVGILAGMEFAGVAIDTELLAELSADMEKTLAALTRKIHKEAGQEFNINSPKQLGEILFDKLGLPVVKKTKTGASTDSEVLQELAETHPLPREILKFRELSKLKSTYVDALPLLADPGNKRVHTSFNQTVTATGRLSSSEPNVQNIPVRTEEGRKIRRAFVAGSGGTCLLSADYSQIELRVLAHLSGDEKLTEAFRRGADVHRFTAGLIFGVPMEQVTDAMRGTAKTVNFGVLYGMGSVSLAKSLDITGAAAKDFIKAYFERYGRVKQYLDGTVEKARRDGYVETAFKRRRYIPEIHSKDPRMKAFAERTAINAPLQGTASDVIKIAMVRIAGRLEDSKTRMILQVHDELLFEVPKKDLIESAAMVRREMSGAVQFTVPMDVAVKSGPNWLDMKEIPREGKSH